MAEDKHEMVEQQPEQFDLTPQIVSAEKNMWNDVAIMKQSWKMAGILANSTVIPQQYRGKVGDCLIAMDIGNRLGTSPIMVMQNSQVVQGNFTWKGSACKAMIDGCGRFDKSEYVYFGEPKSSEWGCFLQAYDKHTDKLIRGPIVTLQMAQDEGWLGKNGSKWKTMPEIMLAYRAATFFARLHCPEVLMGFMTAEEQKDVNGYDDDDKKKVVIEL